MRCPYCGITMTTNIDFHNGFISYISIFLVLITFGLSFSLILIPLTFLFTKEMIHKYYNSKKKKKK
jgi:hypothetical protein